MWKDITEEYVPDSGGQIVVAIQTDLKALRAVKTCVSSQKVLADAISPKSVAPARAPIRNGILTSNGKSACHSDMEDAWEMETGKLDL